MVRQLLESVHFSRRSRDPQRDRVDGGAGRGLPGEREVGPGHLLAELRVAGRLHEVLPRR